MSRRILMWALTVVVFAVILIVAGALIYDLPTTGVIAMSLGVIASLAVGVGLMALLFYSNRSGADEPFVLEPPPAGLDNRHAGSPRA